DLVAELDTRQEFLASTRPASPAEPGVGTSPARRGAGRNAVARALMPVTDDPTAPARVEAFAVSTLGHDQKHAEGSSRTEGHAMGDPTAKGAATLIHDLDRLQPGHRIQVWHRGQLQCVGTVEETAPNLDVLWIREDVDGYRRMIHTQDTELRYHRPGTAR
ncbi:hypothetical protein, partial [Kocuria arenosa]|uniref:hypothetical protein n=1 Tax=Kocuria arenosa TaxID=3071446 RepID=UPI0034D6A134